MFEKPFRSVDRHPVWIPERRELILGDEVLARIRRPAGLVQLALDTFQADGWPEYIDDPIPPDRLLKQSPHRRLNDLVKRLNRCQKGPTRIYFYSDGNGEGIFWSPTPIDCETVSRAR